MEVAIRKLGNSQGVLIPKPILAQLGLEGTAGLQVRDRVIVAPMTTGSRPARFRIALTLQGKRGLIVLGELRTLDRARLVKRLGTLRPAKLAATLQTLQAMLAAP